MIISYWLNLLSHPNNSRLFLSRSSRIEVTAYFLDVLECLPAGHSGPSSFVLHILSGADFFLLPLLPSFLPFFWLLSSFNFLPCYGPLSVCPCTCTCPSCLCFGQCMCARPRLCLHFWANQVKLHFSMRCS